MSYQRLAFTAPRAQAKDTGRWGEDEHLIPDTHLGLARPSRSQPGDASETCSCAWGPSCTLRPSPPSVSPAPLIPWSSRVFHRCYFFPISTHWLGQLPRALCFSKRTPSHFSAPSTLSNDLF